MRNISKRLFLNTLVCETFGWIKGNQNFAEQTLSIGEKFRIEEGIEIGERARSAFPGGLLIDELKMSSAVEKTKSAIEDPYVSVIFEGAFQFDGFGSRADILRRSEDGWDMLEVKSSINEDEKFIDDMAYTVMVLSRSGLEISTVSLLLISRDYRLGMDNQDLFVEYDYTAKVLQRVKDFEPFWCSVKQVMSGSDMPEPRLEFICKQCSIFRGCLGKDIDNHIFEIPRLSEAKFNDLSEYNIVCIEDIPDDFPLTENQAIVRETVLKKSPSICASLGPALGQVNGPPTTWISSP